MTQRAKKLKARRASPRARRNGPARSPKSDPLDNFITAGADSLGLKIERSWMPAVRANLAVTLRHAALVTDFALPDDAEPAPVFRA